MGPSSFSSVAQRLRRDHARIIETWERHTRNQIPAARPESSPALRDTMPVILAELADALDHPAPNQALEDREQELGRSHGEQRAALTAYSLEQVVSEYQLLRQVMFQVLEEESPLNPAERNILLDGIELSIRNAVGEFSRQRTHDAEVAHRRLEEAHAGLEREVQKRTDALMTSEERFRLFIEQVRDYALFTVDPLGVITFWNQGAARMKGYAVDEAVGNNFRMLYPQEARDRRDPEDHLLIAAREGRFRGEGMRRRKDGSLFLADVLITPMYRGDQLIGFSKVVQDLTERTLLVRERDLSRSAVESFRIEREVRERFIAMVSHDLRTPVSAAKISAQLILRRPQAHDRHMELAGRVVSNLDRLERMISDLLDASRLREGQALSVQLSRFELGDLAREVAEDLATIHGDRFTVHSLDRVEGFWSRDGLRRVIENLAVNAVKYGAPESPITISIHRSANRAGLRVLNLGKGLTAEDQANLFQHFRRGSDAEGGVQQGWGVGLTVVRGVVEALGGTVAVTSTPNSGTSFVVDLPMDARPFAKTPQDSV